MSAISNEKREHAIVLGSSIAGLFTARILSDHFQRVTIVERDLVHDEPESRKGQPHTRHLHGILEPAHRFISTYLPGVEQSLIDGGALSGDFGEYVRWYHSGGYRLQSHVGLTGIVLSRPFLEWHVRRFVTALANITLLSETAAEGLVTNADRSRVTGVKVKHRDGGGEETLNADLVIDVTGRGSSTPKWLTQLGYDAPPEEEVKVRVGYATRMYRRVENPEKPLQCIMITPHAPQEKRGAILFPIEGDRWIVTTGGWHGDHAPADEAAFIDYLRSLPAPDIYDVISKAEPLSEIALYKYPSSRRLHYEKLSRFPEGFLVLGDAVASFNPIYGQGMSSAALQVEALNDLLRQGTLQGVWRMFFRRVSRVVDWPWQLAVGEDFRYPETEGKRPFGIDLINRYIARVHRATHRDAVVYEQFLKVVHLLAAPTTLLQPCIMWRVLYAAIPRDRSITKAVTYPSSAEGLTT